MSGDKCTADLTIQENGDFTIRPRNRKRCDALLKKINPIRGTFWRNHIKEETVKSEKKQKD